MTAHHQHRDNSPQCPICRKRNMDKRTLKEGYYCRNCSRLIPMEQIRWPSQRPKAAGSGQIAGPTYRHRLARALLEKYERERRELLEEYERERAGK